MRSGWDGGQYEWRPKLETKDELYAKMDGILWHDTMGCEIDSIDAKVTHRRCSQQGWFDDVATQNRPSGDHENMRK